MEEKSIIGSFVSSNMGDDGGKIFRSYIWEDKDIIGMLNNLKPRLYGNDLELVLFKFYINPIPYLLDELKKESVDYRKKEKSISLPIIITHDNFFSKSEAERYDFIKSSLMTGIDFLSKVVTDKKLDTNVKLLKDDVITLLTN